MWKGVGHVLGWVGSGSILIHAFLLWLVIGTYFMPTNLAEWFNQVAVFLLFALAIVALNPLSWNLPVFGTVVLRGVTATFGLVVATVLRIYGPSPPSH